MANGSDSTEVLFVDVGPWFGGAQRSLLTLVTGIREHGIVPIVAGSDSSEGGLLSRCRDAEIACCDIAARHWRRTPMGVLELRSDIRRLRGALRELSMAHAVRAVHANSARAALLASFAVPGELPLVTHCRDLSGPAIVRGRVGRRSSAIIAISQAVARRWEAFAPKVSVIYNGLDIGGLAATAPQEAFPAAENGLRVVLVADMAPWKRHDLVLAAVAAVHARFPGIRALVVGRATTNEGKRWLASLQDRARELRISQAVRFITDAQDAVPWIAGADVLVSAAESEPFGRTVAEALAVGKPVVAVRGGGPEEILGDSPAGTVVDADADAMARAILAWRGADRRADIADAAVERARQFDAPRMVEQVARVLQQAYRRTP